MHEAHLEFVHFQRYLQKGVCINNCAFLLINMIRKSGKAPASSEREDDDISLSFPIQNSSNSVHSGT